MVSISMFQMLLDHLESSTEFVPSTEPPTENPALLPPLLVAKSFQGCRVPNSLLMPMSADQLKTWKRNLDELGKLPCSALFREPVNELAVGLAEGYGYAMGKPSRYQF
jgi:hypothetical protein